MGKQGRIQNFFSRACTTKEWGVCTPYTLPQDPPLGRQTTTTLPFPACVTTDPGILSRRQPVLKMKSRPHLLVFPTFRCVSRLSKMHTVKNTVQRHLKAETSYTHGQLKPTSIPSSLFFASLAKEGRAE